MKPVDRRLSECFSQGIGLKTDDAALRRLNEMRLEDLAALHTRVLLLLLLLCPLKICSKKTMSVIGYATIGKISLRLGSVVKKSWKWSKALRIVSGAKRRKQIL